MPRLWVMSDLHLETVRHPEAFRPERPEFDVLVVAGDVWEGDTDRGLRIVTALAGGRPSVFVLGGAGQGSIGESRWKASGGNHEFWDREVAHERSVAHRAAARHGVTLLDDDAVELAGVRFVGGTLWADGLLAGAAAAPDQPTGERIRAGQGRHARPVTGRDEATLHRRTRAIIEAAAARPADGCALIVVTHHAPHPLCLPAAYRTGWGAGNAASDLSHFTDAGRIALWVHGHIHDTVDLVRPGGTRIVCNPAGARFGNPGFRDDLVVNI